MVYVYFILLIFSYKLFKNKKNYYIFYIIFFIIVMGLNIHHLNYGSSSYNNYDFYNYYTLYKSSANAISDRNAEIGFKILFYLFNQIGLKFYQARLLISVVGYLLIISTIKKYTNNINYVLLLYLFYPFINDVIQIRNFLAVSIFIFSTRFLIEKPKLYVFKYSLFLLIASLFHISIIYYFLILVFLKMNKKQTLYTLFIIMPIFITLSYTDLYKNLILFLFDNEKLFYYLSRKSTIGFIPISIMFIFRYIVFIIFYKEAINQVNNFDNIYYKKNIYDIIFKMNMAAFLIFPLLVYNYNFIRLYRNILILNYVLYSDVIYIIRKNGKKGNLYIFLSLILVLILFLQFYVLHYDTQILPVFQDNLINLSASPPVIGE